MDQQFNTAKEPLDNALCRGRTVLSDPMIDGFEISDRAIVEHKIHAGLGAQSLDTVARFRTR